MRNLLIRSAVRYLFKHPLQFILSIIGIALGVAVVVAIDLANSSSAKAFELSMETIAGKATHQILGEQTALPDSLYTFLKVKKSVNPIAPVVQADVKTLRPPQKIFTLIGVDPFAEKPFRSFLSAINGKINNDISAFLIKPSSILISSVTAKQMGLRENDTLSILAGGNYKVLRILGFIQPEDSYSRQILENLLISDISTAQEILNMPGTLSRLDLIVPENEKGEQELMMIRRSLPPGIVINRSETRTQIASDMVKAFDINLTALSLLALIVGMFLIYNTMTFSVVQRRRYIGLLRSLGVTQKEVFGIFLIEALVEAFIGTILGLLIGIILGRGMVQIVSRTITDLYFSVSVNALNISAQSLIKGFMIGIGATVIAALKPSLEASAVPPGVALSRSEQEIKLKRKVPRLSMMGIVSVVIGIIILSIPGKNIYLSYAGILPIIIGFSLMTPLMVIILMKILGKLSARILGVLGKIAAMSVVTQISRTAVAVAALSVAVSATVGIGTMINSFRQTVVKWLEGNLQADIYISPASLVLRQTDSALDSSLVKKVLKLPEVIDYNFFYNITQNQSLDNLNVIALRIGERSYNDFKFKNGDPNEIWPEFQNNDAAIITEPYAYKNNTKVNDQINIPTPEGTKKIRVAGIYYDYSSDIGFIVISYNTYRRYWKSNLISGISVFLKNGTNRDSIISIIQKMTKPGEEILVRSNVNLKNSSMEVFDRTFLITNVLQILAIVVAFIGILSSLMALQLERSREFAILRANGLTPLQLWRLLILQTGFMGFISGILSLPLGNALAWILIYIINKRSFGWTLQFIIMPDILFQALLVSLFAAILAGLYPAFKMSRTSPALALREE